MYHLSVLPPKQHEIPLIVSRQISIPNVSPNLTDAHIAQYPVRCTAQRAFHFCPLADLFIPTPTRLLGKHSCDAAITRNDYITHISTTGYS